jgi:regulator of replication initiation timing
MPEWLGHVITGICSAAFVAAMFTGYVRVLDRKRFARRDEVDVLLKTVDGLEKDRDALKAENVIQRVDLNKLRDDLTACKVAHERIQVIEKYLTEENADLAKRVGELEAEVSGFRGGAA